MGTAMIFVESKRVGPDAAVDEGFSDRPYDGSLAQEIAWQPREGVEVCRRWVILPAAQSSKDDRKPVRDDRRPRQ